ncbi:MAG: 1-acyl-sn-glycerol-3-phosphate acyltransferase [Candidatus Geothermincolia bacterium]
MAEIADLAALEELVTENPSADSTDNFDYHLVRLALAPVRAIARLYFRAEVEGIERVPEGKAMIVGNHNAGITFLEPFMMGAEWYRHHGEDEPLYVLAHDAMVSIPLLRNVLLKFGCVRASMENSRKLFDEGRKLVVFPGGNHEAFRKYTERHQIEFAGHKGFARLAVETDVPIVPMLFIGGHETFFVLTRGERLGRLLHSEKILRSKSFPIAIALPWGLMVGPFFHFPLPAKSTIEFGEPFLPSEVVRRNAKREKKVEAVYDETVGRLQDMMDRQAAKRRFPVIG